MITTSVIICTWNRVDLLRQTLDSLALQSGIEAKRIEVLVVDNNSSDGTRRAVEQIALKWPLGDLVYLYEPRQGKQFALNLGVRLARGTVLAFTDDDIIFPHDWLAQVETTFRDGGIELAGGKTSIGWPPRGKPHWYAEDMLAILAGVDLGEEVLDPSPLDYAPAGSNLIARKELFTKVGYYSELHFRHMDHEFGIRCQNRGVRVVYDPRLVVHAPADPDCLTPRYFQRWSFKAGLLRGGGVDAAGKGFPKVPAWIYRQALEDALFMLTRIGRLRGPQSFQRELRLWRAAGTIANAWHAWLRPGKHAAWVKARSQKKDNKLY